MGANGNRAVRADATKVGTAVGQSQGQPSAQRDTRAEPFQLIPIRSAGRKARVGAVRSGFLRSRASVQQSHARSCGPGGLIGFGIEYGSRGISRDRRAIGLSVPRRLQRNSVISHVTKSRCFGAVEGAGMMQAIKTARFWMLVYFALGFVFAGIVWGGTATVRDCAVVNRLFMSPRIQVNQH